MDYIDRIKQLKAEQKVTNDELSERTGIPLGTLSKILAGISDSPKLSNIVLICNALGCSLDYAVSGIPENRNNFTLEPGEISLIENYRELDRHGREMVTLVLDKERERLRSASYGEGERTASPAASFVQPAAKAKILRPTPAVTGLSRRNIPLFDLPVSAGTGVFLDDTTAEEITIPENARTEGADFAVRISGHSMEPRFRDGDVLLVSDCDSVENGELGIFVLDGSGYFKVFGGDRLISLNPEFGDIMLKDFTEISCCGKVIGKLKRK